MFLLQLCVERFDFFYGVLDFVDFSLRVATGLNPIKGFLGRSLKVTRSVCEAPGFLGESFHSLGFVTADTLWVCGLI